MMQRKAPPARTLAFPALLCLVASLVNAQNAPTNQTADSWLIPSDKLNSELPPWLQFSGEERVRGEGTLGIDFRPSTDRYLLQRLRLNMQVKPRTWLKFEFQAQDARAFWREGPQQAPYRDTWDLRQAYLEIGELKRHHAAFRMGRQELAFGDERLMGISNWTNTTRTFDAYRVTLQYKKVKMDAFAASVVSLFPGEIGSHVRGNYIEGFYGEITNWIPRSEIQPYFFWRRSPGIRLGNGTLGTSHLATTGLRWAGKLPRGFSYETETTLQRGSINSDSISAWATHLQMNQELPFLTASRHPVYIAEFNYASGDKNPSDTVHSTFDTLYASAHNKIEFADQVGWKNVRSVRTGADFPLARKLRLSVRYTDIWLANAHDSLYASNGAAVAAQTNGSAGRWVGQEFDGTWDWALTKTTQLGAGYGYLLPGTFLKMTTPGKAFRYPFLYYQTNF